jgi:deoxyinosine 3'endonuclease (endonuclease V)
MVFGHFYLQWLRWKWGRQQVRLRQQLLEEDDFAWTVDINATDRQRLRFIAGVDISFFSNEQDPHDQRACSALVVFELDMSGNLTMVWEDFEFIYMDQPYIAGFLAFREVPHLLSLLERLRKARPELMPDVILVDGNGVLHPKGFGCASHFGVVSDTCCIGIAKNLHMIDGLDRNVIRKEVELVGQGGHVPLVGDSGRTWGAALLPDPPNKKALKHVTNDAKNPIFVSVGHRISLETSLHIANMCCSSRREPEPTRIADMRSREIVRQAKALRFVFDLMNTLSEHVSSVSEAEVGKLKGALKDARSVMSSKEILKPANRVLTILELGPQAQQSKYESARSEALAKMVAALGPPLRRPPNLVQTLLIPFGTIVGLGFVVVLARRLGSSSR